MSTQLGRSPWRLPAMMLAALLLWGLVGSGAGSGTGGGLGWVAPV